MSSPRSCVKVTVLMAYTIGMFIEQSHSGVLTANVRWLVRVRIREASIKIKTTWLSWRDGSVVRLLVTLAEGLASLDFALMWYTYIYADKTLLYTK